MARLGISGASSLSWLGLLVLLGGCPEIGRITYRFDLTRGAGSLSFEDIGTDDPASSEADFAQIVNEWVLGSKVADEHPTWRVGERKIFEKDGRLDGLVLFTFETPEDAGLYKHDRKSPYLWCAGEGETVISTSGTIVPQYPTCVVFDRKAKTAEITVTNGTGLGTRTSLLSQFRVWDGQRLPDSGNLGGLGEMFGDAMREALEGTGDPGSFDLGSLLPESEAGAAWSELGLPIEGGKVVRSSDTVLQVAHGGLSLADALAKYGQALAAQGYTAVSQGAEDSVWSKGADKLTVVATQAGSTVVVSLAR
jgi:hypothetical protein